MPDFSTSSVGCTCFALRKLTRTVTRLYDHHLATVALKTTQYSLLKSVAYEPLPVATLAMRLSTERTTLTRNLKPLIEAGWVELKPGEDARQRIVMITGAGRDRIKAAKQAWRRAQTELERALGMDMVRSLHMQVDTALEQLTPLLSKHTLPQEHTHANSD